MCTIRTLILGLLFLTCSQGFAGRTLISPPLDLVSYHDYKKSVWEEPTSMAEGTPIISGFIVKITLSNLSKIPQTGTVSFNNGSGSYGNNMCCPAYSMNTTVVVCGNVSGTKTSASASGISSYTGEGKWTLAPNSSTVVAIVAMGEGTYSATLGPAKTFAASISLTGTLKISVNEDRGAIQGSISTFPNSSSGGSYCGYSWTNMNYGKYINVSGTDQVIQLNGGRPF
ncbi:hypothetical protein [Bdellovibrio bacteriovorus]|uniref:hypothetical protein n=1 Tax=Bdellovibrio TaxID=958 RepID=UPI0035A83BA2